MRLLDRFRLRLRSLFRSDHADEELATRYRCTWRRRRARCREGDESGRGARRGPPQLRAGRGDRGCLPRHAPRLARAEPDARPALRPAVAAQTAAPDPRRHRLDRRRRRRQHADLQPGKRTAAGGARCARAARPRQRSHLEQQPRVVSRLARARRERRAGRGSRATTSNTRSTGATAIAR